MQRSFGTVISGNRRPTNELSSEQRAGILAAVEAGEKKSEIAKRFRVSRNTVYETIHRFNETNSTQSRPRSGGPRALSARDERLLLRTVKKEPKLTYNGIIQQTKLNVSRTTIRRILKQYGIKKKIAAKRPLLSTAMAEKRLAFANKMADFDWSKALFSDECSYEPGSGTQRRWIFRESGQKWDKDKVAAVPKSGGKPVMIWAAIGLQQRSALIFMNRRSEKNGYNAESYREALEEGLVPIYEPGMAFQQDNAPIHKAGGTKDWFGNHGIWVIDWPPCSPDLNPIEHAWAMLKRKTLDKYPESAYLG